ncbi:glycoside hydrolase family 30 protein [Mucilaginibacter sp. SP1R1]|uniref:glycoside hydrolase family 30 protein n=1 Tax=Mucilaginibacter sp. SP1R1 TaxID=2723091 RepID=UPI001619D067|nr:glycoside hydrolase family 30 beta sandwich domain-containing protein [Mucilaginibacter sp. SP1R1]MBB6148434.1 glucosylceramidase [Mucilaginibacter sp. SP1R1]
MNKSRLLTVALFAALCTPSLKVAAQNTTTTINSPQAWLTDPSDSILFKSQDHLLKAADKTAGLPVITIDKNKTYQQMDGFGFALTGGSAMLINQMSSAKQATLLTELFTLNKNNIGVSYLRISIGASDLDDHVFSYDDLPAGETDPELKKFNLGNDYKALIPVLKKIIALNPGIKILASPWSAPTWMKTNNSSIGGNLKPEYYYAYAQYFIKYIKAMQANGIRIDAVTLQNEPLNPKNNPSMVMEAAEQANFIAQNIGPEFRAAGIKTKIVLYDHNADRPDYPITILNNPEAKKYIDGSAFHLYGGQIGALTQVHDAHPDKNLYFTEQWVGAPGDLKKELSFHITDIIIGAPRNWCRNVIEWNLASDQDQNPHTPGGCDQCLGAITINNNVVTRNPAYYIIAHASKFVRPGSKRITSNYITALPNVAFITPAGKIVLIVFNNGQTTQKFNIQNGKNKVSTTLNANAVATYIL